MQCQPHSSTDHTPPKSLLAYQSSGSPHGSPFIPKWDRTKDTHTHALLTRA